MTLRLRLVVAIVCLATAGLALFGVVTYSLYSGSEYQSLDRQLRASVPVIAGILQPVPVGPGGFGGNGGDGGRGTGGTGAGNGGPFGGSQPSGSQPGGHHGPGGGGTQAPPILVPYGALYDSAGKRIATLPLDSESPSSPKLPAGAFTASHVGSPFATGSLSGSTGWLVLIARGSSGDFVVVATPTTNVVSSLHDLVLIETSAALGLLVLLSLGAGIVLRRGLRPLEEMATTAKAISAGDLSQRVPSSKDQSEVGQLGSALNAMLEDIQSAFAARDATEEKLRQFLADASHELRTPLTSIQGYAELARLGRGEPDADTGPEGVIDAATALERIEGQAARMRLLVEELLLLARLDRTREAERSPVDLTVLAADACSEAVAVDPGRPVSFEGPEPVLVLGDASHLRQAISNLLTNAIRHTKAGTPIEVSSHRDDGRAVVSVRDHGAGLDPAALDHVFDRFWRADSSRATEGVGLGLSIVQAVAKEHGGEALAGNSEGGGAIFTLVLPAQAVAPAGGSTQSGAAAGSPAAAGERSAGVPSTF
jgi:two-component system OmpR family sensor kinase